ncbi:hypothetical protein FB451DRAFT_1461377 [Mycena latifolia]|nr:hypothetical protein FB451DRAFT_1461377 [Mycena latifolia]
MAGGVYAAVFRAGDGRARALSAFHVEFGTTFAQILANHGSRRGPPSSSSPANPTFKHQPRCRALSSCVSGSRTFPLKFAPPYGAASTCRASQAHCPPPLVGKGAGGRIAEIADESGAEVADEAAAGARPLLAAGASAARRTAALCGDGDGPAGPARRGSLSGIIVIVIELRRKLRANDATTASAFLAEGRIGRDDNCRQREVAADQRDAQPPRSMPS